MPTGAELIDRRNKGLCTECGDRQPLPGPDGLPQLICESCKFSRATKRKLDQKMKRLGLGRIGK
jgi:hypothetical protein